MCKLCLCDAKNDRVCAQTGPVLITKAIRINSYILYCMPNASILRGIFRAQTHLHFRKIWNLTILTTHPPMEGKYMNHTDCMSQKTNLKYDSTVLINGCLSLWLSFELKIFVRSLHHNNQPSHNQLHGLQLIITKTMNWCRTTPLHFPMLVSLQFHTCIIALKWYWTMFGYSIFNGELKIRKKVWLRKDVYHIQFVWHTVGFSCISFIQSMQ